VKGKEQTKLAQDGDQRRTHIASAGDQQQIAHDIENDANDKGACQVVLLVDGDQHILRDAVVKLNRDAPDDEPEDEVGTPRIVKLPAKELNRLRHIQILGAADNAY